MKRTSRMPEGVSRWRWLTDKKNPGTEGCLFPDSEEEVFFEKVKRVTLFTSLLLIV